jgi:aldose 1-epimerase
MIKLSAGRLRLSLDPDTGGAIAAFTHDGTPLLRPVADPRLAAQHGRAVAAYPLIPFANRVAFGRFSLHGKGYRLDQNFGDQPHTIHGNAWMRRWETLRSNETMAHLALDHTPPEDPASEWPFAYRARQRFTLHEHGLTIEMSVQNRDSIAWPAGLGLHPYIVRDSEPGARTMLKFDADSVWTNGADALPAERLAVCGHWEFAAARALGHDEIDECYAGWGGLADVAWPSREVSLRLATEAPMDHIQLYTPPGEDYFGLEPVSNMPDAINRMDEVADNGLKMLQPEETLVAVIGLEIKASD